MEALAQGLVIKGRLSTHSLSLRESLIIKSNSCVVIKGSLIVGDTIRVAANSELRVTTDLSTKRLVLESFSKVIVNNSIILYSSFETMYFSSIKCKDLVVQGDVSIKGQMEAMNVTIDGAFKLEDESNVYIHDGPSILGSLTVINSSLTMANKLDIKHRLTTRESNIQLDGPLDTSSIVINNSLVKIQGEVKTKSVTIETSNVLLNSIQTNTMSINNSLVKTNAKVKTNESLVINNSDTVMENDEVKLELEDLTIKNSSLMTHGHLHTSNINLSVNSILISHGTLMTQKNINNDGKLMTHKSFEANKVTNNGEIVTNDKLLIHSSLENTGNILVERFLETGSITIRKGTLIVGDDLDTPRSLYIDKALVCIGRNATIQTFLHTKGVLIVTGNLEIGCGLTSTGSLSIGRSLIIYDSLIGGYSLSLCANRLFIYGTCDFGVKSLVRINGYSEILHGLTVDDYSDIQINGDLLVVGKTNLKTNVCLCVKGDTEIRSLMTVSTDSHFTTNNLNVMNVIQVIDRANVFVSGDLTAESLEIDSQRRGRLIDKCDDVSDTLVTVNGSINLRAPQHVGKRGRLINGKIDH